MGLGLITCGEVEDVVGALTPVGGVAQVFHELLVGLQLLLAEEEEQGREDGREVESGDQGEETTLTWMTMMMGPILVLLRIHPLTRVPSSLRGSV